MAWTVDRSKTYQRTVKDPETGETAVVTFKKLTHGQIQKRREVGIKRPKGSRNPGRMKWDPKAVDDYTILTSIVEWELPLPLTAETLSKLDPAVIEQINDHIEDINPVIKRERGEEDDEDEDEDEDEDDEEGSDEPEPVRQAFGEEEGPTRLAASS